MFKFDLSVIGEGAEIRNAVLAVYQSGFVFPNDQEVNTLHRITRDWKADEITWDYASNGVRWDTAGGDYDRVALAQASLVGMNQWEEYDVTNIISEMVSGRLPDYGIMLKTFDGNSAVRVYKSSSSDSLHLRPKLTVTYIETGIISRRSNSIPGQFSISLINGLLNVSLPRGVTCNGYRIITFSGRVVSRRGSFEPVNSLTENITGIAGGIYYVFLETSRGPAGFTVIKR